MTKNAYTGDVKTRSETTRRHFSVSPSTTLGIVALLAMVHGVEYVTQNLKIRDAEQRARDAITIRDMRVQDYFSSRDPKESDKGYQILLSRPACDDMTDLFMIDESELNWNSDSRFPYANSTLVPKSQPTRLATVDVPPKDILSARWRNTDEDRFLEVVVLKLTRDGADYDTVEVGNVPAPVGLYHPGD